MLNNPNFPITFDVEDRIDKLMLRSKTCCNRVLNDQWDCSFSMVAVIVCDVGKLLHYSIVFFVWYLIKRNSCVHNFGDVACFRLLIVIYARRNFVSACKGHVGSESEVQKVSKQT